MKNKEYVPMHLHNKSNDPRHEEIAGFLESSAKNTADAEEYRRERKKLEVSLMGERKIMAGEISRIQDAVMDKSSKGLVDDVLQLPVGKTEQLESNIKKLKIAEGIATQKSREFKGKASQIEKQMKEEEIDRIAIKAFDELKKVFDFYKVANNYFFNNAIPAIDLAYEADSRFCDVNGRAKRLGLHKLLAHTITNVLKEGGTGAVSMEAVVRHVRYNFDSEGIENMILPRIYDKTEDVNPYRDEF